MSRAPLPPEVTRLRATNRKDRPRERVIEPVPGEPRKPTWLKGRAARIWREKLAIYARRGQNVAGCGSSLAVYCRLEATILDTWDAGCPPTAALLMGYKQLCDAFFDLPAAQVRTTKTKDNPFAQNGRRPKE